LSLHDNQITRDEISLALLSGRDNHPLAATAEMAILIVAVFPSRLTRHMEVDYDPHRHRKALCTPAQHGEFMRAKERR
jgi:hypothetical protein